MILGIVGSEQAKFNKTTEEAARELIRWFGRPAECIVSGECHLGGVDLYAKQEAEALAVPYHGYPPAKLQWEGGYKQRNLEIARASDRVICITVSELPSTYTGMRFARCYHCGPQDHVKSGGCWTVKQAVKMGKEGYLAIIYPNGDHVYRPYA